MQATNLSCQISGNKELCGPLAMDGSSMNLEVLFSGPSVQTMVAKIQEVGKILYTNLYDVQQSYCYLHPVLVAILAIKKSYLSQSNNIFLQIVIMFWELGKGQRLPIYVATLLQTSKQTIVHFCAHCLE